MVAMTALSYRIITTSADGRRHLRKNTFSDDGELYPADVINVAKKRMTATVRHFVVYDDGWDTWLPVSVLKSKL